jgi:hypothetical protein
MIKKQKPSAFFANYLGHARDYLVVAEAEAVFFEAIIQNKTEFRNNVSIQQALNNAAYFLEDRKGRPLTVLVEFEVIEPRTKGTQQMFLGTQLRPPNETSEAQVSHYLCLGDELNLIAKIHHDRDFSVDALERKPSPHIQIGGRVDPALAAKARGPCCWRNDVDKPRLPSFPICTALLWHWAFLEYQDSAQVAPVFETWWWRRIVQKAEQSILKPFFVDARELIERGPQGGFLRAFYDPVAR